MNQLTEQQRNDIKFVLQNFTHETLQKDLIALNTLKSSSCSEWGEKYYCGDLW